MSQVIVYGYEQCRYCSSAKALLAFHGIRFEYRDVKKEFASKAQFLELSSPPPRTVPQIVIAGTLIGGYTDLEAHFMNPDKIEAAREAGSA